ncbi:hypothetical protein V8F06_007441 [Rhypophila decipiens]
MALWSTPLGPLKEYVDKSHSELPTHEQVLAVRYSTPSGFISHPMSPAFGGRAAMELIKPTRTFTLLSRTTTTGFTRAENPPRSSPELALHRGDLAASEREKSDAMTRIRDSHGTCSFWFKWELIFWEEAIAGTSGSSSSPGQRSISTPIFLKIFSGVVDYRNVWRTGYLGLFQRNSECGCITLTPDYSVNHAAAPFLTLGSWTVNPRQEYSGVHHVASPITVNERPARPGDAVNTRPSLTRPQEPSPTNPRRLPTSPLRSGGPSDPVIPISLPRGSFLPQGFVRLGEEAIEAGMLTSWLVDELSGGGAKDGILSSRFPGVE